MNVEKKDFAKMVRDMLDRGETIYGIAKQCTINSPESGADHHKVTRWLEGTEPRYSEALALSYYHQTVMRRERKPVTVDDIAELLK